MKRLFLVRHAKASCDDPQLDDHERPLTNRGRKQADAMGPVLAAVGVLDGAVYASDAVRARQTAEGLIRGAGRVSGKPPDGVPVHFCPELYTFDAGVLRSWLQHYPGDEDSLSIIGHNPALLELAGSLLEQPPAGLPTGSLIEIALPIKSWQELGQSKGKLERFLTPKDVC